MAWDDEAGEAAQAAPQPEPLSEQETAEIFVSVMLPKAREVFHDKEPSEEELRSFAAEEISACTGIGEAILVSVAATVVTGSVSALVKTIKNELPPPNPRCPGMRQERSRFNS